MSKVDVVNWSGQKVSQADLASAIFKTEVHLGLLHEVVNWQRASKRAGSHKTKTRSEVRGGGKKPFRQKGTGNARQGSIRSPLLEGGGVAHGPRPRFYGWALPKQTRQRALRSALSHLVAENKLIAVENMESTEGKTKEVFNRFKKMKLGKTLLVGEAKEEKEKLFKRACKNLKDFKFISVEGLNVYDLLNYNKVVITSSALNQVNKKYGEVKKSTRAQSDKSAKNKKTPSTQNKTSTQAKTSSKKEGN